MCLPREDLPEALDGIPGIPSDLFVTNIQIDECLSDSAHLRIDVFIASSTKNPPSLWGRVFNEDPREEGVLLQAIEMDTYAAGKTWWLHARYSPSMRRAHVFWGPKDICFRLPEVIPLPRMGKDFCQCGRNKAAGRAVQGANAALEKLHRNHSATELIPAKDRPDSDSQPVPVLQSARSATRGDGPEVLGLESAVSQWKEGLRIVGGLKGEVMDVGESTARRLSQGQHSFQETPSCGVKRKRSLDEQHAPRVRGGAVDA